MLRLCNSIRFELKRNIFNRAQYAHQLPNHRMFSTAKPSMPRYFNLQTATNVFGVYVVISYAFHNNRVKISWEDREKKYDYK